MVCKKCNKEHDGSFGNGNFCSYGCSRGGGWNKEQRKNISEILKNSEKAKIANELQKKPPKQPKETKCEKCGKIHNGLFGSGKFCSRSCANSRIVKEGTKLTNCINCNKEITVNKFASNSLCNECKKVFKLNQFTSNIQCEKRIFYQVKCVICNNEFTTECSTKKVCSQTCAYKLRSITYQKNKKYHKPVGGYNKGSGRGKSGWYKKYWCDSSYELAFVIYCLDKNIKIKRNKEKFFYKYKEKILAYIPDFIVNDKLIEIKGFETEQTKLKYLSVTRPLKILYKDDLKQVFEYVENKYGKDFIKLYEGNPYKQLTKNCKQCGVPIREDKVFCSRSCCGKYMNWGNRSG